VRIVISEFAIESWKECVEEVNLQERKNVLLWREKEAATVKGSGWSLKGGRNAMQGLSCPLSIIGGFLDQPE
jgi:hypothetical protein